MMKAHFTRLTFLLLPALFFTTKAEAQFYDFIPGICNYINSDVKADTSGLTFRYMWQDSTLAIHRALIHTTNDGETVWTKRASQNFGSYLTLPDNSMILSGGRSITGGTRIGLLQKNNPDGTISWTHAVTSTTNDVSVGNLMRTGNTIIATVTRSAFFSSTYMNKAAIIAFDTAGALLWTKYFSNPTFTTDYYFARTMIAANGDILAVADIRGSSGNSANGMMITRLTPSGTIVFSKYVNFLSARHNQLSVTGLTELPNGDIILGGRLMTDQISIYPNTMWLGKLNSAGDLLLQKTIHGGTDVGEQLHSLQYANGKLYAYMPVYSPFNTVSRSLLIGEIDPQTLSFTATQTALEIAFHPEDPYGQVANSFCMTTDGKPTASAGFYCTETNKYYPIMLQVSADNETSCTDDEVPVTFIDSIANFPFTTYTPQGTFAVTFVADTAQIHLSEITPFERQDLCAGCVSTLSAGEQVNTAAISIYPNPNDGQFTISSPATGPDDAFEVLNTQGAVIYAGNLSVALTPVNLQGHAPGMYYIKIARKGQAVTMYKVVSN